MIGEKRLFPEKHSIHGYRLIKLAKHIKKICGWKTDYSTAPLDFVTASKHVVLVAWTYALWWLHASTTVGQYSGLIIHIGCLFSIPSAILCLVCEVDVSIVVFFPISWIVDKTIFSDIYGISSASVVRYLYDCRNRLRDEVGLSTWRLK